MNRILWGGQSKSSAYLLIPDEEPYGRRQLLACKVVAVDAVEIEFTVFLTKSVFFTDSPIVGPYHVRSWPRFERQVSRKQLILPAIDSNSCSPLGLRLEPRDDHSRRHRRKIHPMG
jgi:hypothetical protein